MLRFIDKAPEIDGYEEVKYLDHGGSAAVYKMKAKIDGRSYICKRFLSKTTLTDYREKGLNYNFNIDQNVERVERTFKNERHIYEKYEGKMSPDMYCPLLSVNTENMDLVFDEIKNAQSLLDALRNGFKPTEEEVKTIIRTCLQFLKTSHELGILHNDINPDNILVIVTEGKLESQSVKLLDFGHSYGLNDREEYQRQSYCNHVFSGPEGLPDPKRPEDKGKCYRATDIHAVGFLLFYLLGKREFWEMFSHVETLTRDGRKDMLEAAGLQEDLLHSSVNSTAQKLLHALIHWEHAKRPSAEKALEHPWFDKVSGSKKRYKVEVDPSQSRKKERCAIL